MVERSAVVQQVLNLFKQPSYLEIGVDAGDTFRSLSAGFKAAVDPEFKFVPPGNTPTVEYHAVTSDVYFGTRCPPGFLFDVAYVDGLHTFEQTLRDVLNVVVRLRPGGVVVVDDILPTSYHASLPSLRDAFRVRDSLAVANPALLGDNTWMGDVYKLAFFVQAFMQQLSYATVAENHGQLILWQQPRPVAAIPQRTMLEIATLGFADTVLSRDVFQVRPFAEILDAIRTAPG